MIYLAKHVLLALKAKAVLYNCISSVCSSEEAETDRGWEYGAIGYELRGASFVKAGKLACWQASKLNILTAAFLLEP